MKNLLLIVLLLCGACFPNERAERLQRPVTLVAKVKINNKWSVVVRGNDGVTVTIGDGYYYAEAIGETYNVGDILK